jgi:hypothetical protein
MAKSAREFLERWAKHFASAGVVLPKPAMPDAQAQA